MVKGKVFFAFNHLAFKKNSSPLFLLLLKIQSNIRLLSKEKSFFINAQQVFDCANI
jgi:hypothetical protein